MRAETVEGFQPNPHQSPGIILIRFSFALALALPVTIAFREMILRVTFVSMSIAIGCDNTLTEKFE